VIDYLMLIHSDIVELCVPFPGLTPFVDTCFPL
jgi:hypothetical protein